MNPLGLTGSVGKGADELVTADARDNAICRQGIAQAAGHHGQDVVSGLVAVENIDLLEIIEVDHEQRDFATVLAGRSDQRVDTRHAAAMVEATSESISFGQLAGIFFSAAALCHFVLQILITTPAKDQQGNVKQHGIGQHDVRRSAATRPGLNDLRHQCAASSGEEDDRCNCNAQRDNIVLSLAQLSLFLMWPVFHSFSRNGLSPS